MKWRFLLQMSLRVVVNRRFWNTFFIFFACILLNFKKHTRKYHTFLHAPQSYTSPLFIQKIILKETIWIKNHRILTICIKKSPHTNNMYKKLSPTNSLYEKPPHTNNMYKKLSHTNNLGHFIRLFACILLDFKKDTHKTHTFLHAPQTYT